MKRVAVLLALVGLGCHPPLPAAEDRASPPPASHAILVISSDLFGYLGPCGCSENMRGGVARAAWQLEQLRREGEPLRFFDAGNTLFRPVTLSDAEVPQEEAKAEAIARALKAMRVDLHGVARLDLARGEGFERGLGLPDLRPGELRSFDLGGHAVAAVSGRSAEEVAAAAKSARAKGAEFVVGFFAGSLADAQTAASRALGVDLLVAVHAEDLFAGEDSRLIHATTPVVDVQSKGRSLLRLDLSFGSGPFVLAASPADQQHEAALLGERIALLDREVNFPGLSRERIGLMEKKIAQLTQRRAAVLNEKIALPQGKNAFTARFLPLEATLPEAPEVAAIVTDYDRKVASLNLAWAKAHAPSCPKAAPGEPSYVGNATCLDCHEEAFAVYRKTKHAHGYQTLVEKEKQYNLECVACHVTGFGKPGGACRVDQVEGREGVGCESCHGPGSLHADDPSRENIRGQVPREVCVVCHNKENSPHFDYAAYLPQILGKGHEHGEKTAPPPSADPD